jgi:hypothetical protein
VTDPITVHPIGIVSGGRDQILEDHWRPVASRLILDPAAVDPDANGATAHQASTRVPDPRGGR